jgi:hypothetical protein
MTIIPFLFIFLYFLLLFFSYFYFPFFLLIIFLSGITTASSLSLWSNDSHGAAGSHKKKESEKHNPESSASHAAAAGTARVVVLVGAGSTPDRCRRGSPSTIFPAPRQEHARSSPAGHGGQVACSSPFVSTSTSGCSRAAPHLICHFHPPEIFFQSAPPLTSSSAAPQADHR